MNNYLFNKKSIIYLIFLIFISQFAINCKERSHCGGYKKYLKVKYLKRKLKLSDEQVKQVETFKDTMKNKQKPYKENMYNIHQEIETLMTSENVKPFRLQAKIKQMHAIKAEIHFLKVQYKLQVKSILNAEQLKKWHELLIKNHKHKKCKDKSKAN